MTLSITELANAERDVSDLAAIVNSPASAPDIVTRLGLSVKPIAKVVSEAGTAGGLEPAVAYAAGIAISRSSQTVIYNTDTYSANPASLPFVTGAGFDPSQWNLQVKKNLLLRAELKALAGAVNGTVLLMVDGFKTGPFQYTTANVKTSCDADPTEILWIKPTGGDGSTGAWQRIFDGDICASWAGVDPAASAASNGATGQAVINAVFALGGGTIRWPNGVTQHTGLIFKNKICHRGGGNDTNSAHGTVLLYTGVGDGIQINNPINSSTAANIRIEGITFKNQNVNAGKGCFADTGSSYLFFHNCGFIGSDRGLILDQTELATVKESDFEGVAGQTTLFWIVQGADRTAGASPQWTNNIVWEDNQFNGASTTILVADDGGTCHSSDRNNYNGGSIQLRAAGVNGLDIVGAGEWESASSNNVELCSTSLAGNGVSSSTNVLFSGASAVAPTAGHPCVHIQSAGTIRFDASFFANTTSAKVTGSANAYCIIALGVSNAGGGSTFDGMASNHFEVNPTTGKIVTNMGGLSTIIAGGQLLFDDPAGTDFQSYVERVAASPYRYHSVVSKGGAGGWAGAYRVRLNLSAGALFDAFKLEPDGSGTRANATFAGALVIPEVGAASVPVPAAGYRTLFFDTDHKLKSMNSVGATSIIGAES